MGNWLEIAAGVFLLGMVLYGHWRGLIRLAVSMLTLVITLAVVRAAMPHAAEFIRQNTSAHEWLAERVKSSYGDGGMPEDALREMPADTVEAQQKYIEGLDLPDEIKELLIENNNNEVYDLLGVSAFGEYIGNYLAGIILNLVGFIILFAGVYIALRLLAGALNLVSRLPIIYGMNQLAGALLGGIHGLVFLWIFFLIVTIFSKTPWAVWALEQIQKSAWLSLLYRHNLLGRFVLGVLRSMVV